MKKPALAAIAILAAVICYGSTANQSAPEKTMHAAGSFDVKITPLTPNDSAGGAIGRLAGEKQWHGDLEATSVGELLTAGDAKSGNAGYVAVERVSGALGGRKGAFTLQHSGVLNAGAQQLTVIIVPGSGSGDLAGISMANFKLRIEPGGKHFYEFDYTLPQTK